jgi:hypothetical protein
VLAAGFNENIQQLLPAFLKQYNPNFPFGWATPDSVYGYLQLSFMQRNYVPDVVFIDRSGTIRAQHAGTDPFFRNERQNVRAMLDKLLSEPAPKSAAPKKKATPKKK